MPSNVLVFVTAALAVLVALVQTLRLFWRGWGARRRLRCQLARAAAGERRAERLLRDRGYRIVTAQAVQAFPVRIDGQVLEVTLRADYLVEKHGRCFIAEVKTGELAPRLETAATRRQLLEYRVAFATDGVLLVDADRGHVHEVSFPLSAPNGGLSPLAAGALGVLLGLAAGLALASAR